MCIYKHIRIAIIIQLSVDLHKYFLIEADYTKNHLLENHGPVMASAVGLVIHPLSVLCRQNKKCHNYNSFCSLCYKLAIPLCAHER